MMQSGAVLIIVEPRANR